MTNTIETKKSSSKLSLREKLHKIAELEKEHAPFGISFALREDSPNAVVPPAEVADYVIAIINRSAELMERFDSIPRAK
jgi:hypothetical protein